MKDSMKIYILKKYFNIDYYDIERIIENKKQGMFSDETQKIIKYITKINAIEDITDLIRINKEIGKRNIGINLGAVYDELYNYYAKEKVEGCFNPEDFKGEKKTILFEGKEVQILKLQGEDYKGIIHAKGTRKNNGGFVEQIGSSEMEREAENENPSDFMRKEDGSDTMSVSIEKDDSMGFFAGCYRYSLLLGFSNIKPENVLRYGKGDSATPVGKGEYDKKIEAINGEVRRYKESDGAHYDELLVSRYCDTDNIKEFRDEEKRILPDYILVFKGKSDFTHLDYDYIEKMNEVGDENIGNSYTKRILRYATTYNIPIVEIDTEKYLEKYQKRYNELLEKMKNGKEKFEKKDYDDMEVARSSIEFYKKYGKEMKQNDVFLEIINDLNITKENRETIKQVIENLDYRNRFEENWQDAINRLPEEMREQAKEKLDFLREELQIGNKDKEKELNEDEQSL